MTITTQQLAHLEQLHKRIAQNTQEPKINNATLPAGSPMHYYCRICQAPTITLPEDHAGTPPKYCYPCQDLVDQGYSPSEQKFIQYQTTQCRTCGGSGLGIRDYYMKRRRRCYTCNGAGTVKKRIDTTQTVAQ